MTEALQGIGLEVIAAIVAALAGLTILDDALAGLVAKVPVIGPILAALVRRLSARFREWMRTKVPASAEAAVKQAEGMIGDGHGPAKKAAAIETLRAAEPGLRNGELEREIQAAFDRLVGGAKLEAPQ